MQFNQGFRREEASWRRQSFYFQLEHKEPEVGRKVHPRALVLQRLTISNQDSSQVPLFTTF